MEQLDSPEIMLFMQTEILSGSIFISTPEGRLLDKLNGRITQGSDNQDKFLKLTDVIIQHINGEQERSALVHVNKKTIEMAATSSANTGRGVGGKPDPKPYPFVDKVPVPIKITMPGYGITGNMYRVNHQKVEHVLLENSMFMPLTDADVTALTSGKRWGVPFLAVNKEQILSLYELNTGDI
jgi:hypothetical protein